MSVPPATAFAAHHPRIHVDACEADTEAELGALIHRQLELLGEDPERDGLARTPERVAKALRWLTRGYRTSVAEVVGSGIFAEDHHDMVLVRDIDVASLCEHHMLPFMGKAHVAYIPNGRILGLSKIPRIVGVFARRLQVQERLTDQVADALVDVLAPAGVAVVIEAQHLCMVMRGVEQQGTTTVTRTFRGAFHDDPHTRDELFRLLSLGR
jgi:GTP cyclohydrolase IA